MRRRAVKRVLRGFMLIVALLMLGLLLAAGMGLMSVQKFRHSASHASRDSLQALTLAQSGLDDARTKLERDINFPPASASDQLTFAYSEDVYIAATRIGGYHVVIDRAHALPPYNVLQIHSVGSVGPSESPFAQRTLHAEMSLDTTSSNYWRWMNFQDDGSN